MTPLKTYQQDMIKRNFVVDKAQESAVIKTQTLYDALISSAEDEKPRGLFQFLKQKKVKTIKGIYCWGGVGRGKSYIIDSFFHSLPFPEKKRIHFNHFMQEIHQKLEGLPKTPDPLTIVARDLASKYRILCIDELHVDDITDAMIMAGFLQALYELNITIVWTSNISPDKLYKNGLQRSRFLPAIELIKTYSEVIELDNHIDYRLALLEKHGTYHVNDSKDSNDIMRQHFIELTGVPNEENQMIEINGRDIQFRAQIEQLIWFDFKALCQTARSSNDYIIIAQDFETVLISDIPKMDNGQNDVVQRFIQLIDALYDHKVKLIITAASEPNLLYQGTILEFPFKRTASRLFEMRSEVYLSQAHMSSPITAPDEAI